MGYILFDIKKKESIYSWVRVKLINLTLIENLQRVKLMKVTARPNCYCSSLENEFYKVKFSQE